MGEEVKKLKFSKVESDLSIDVSSLPAGIYFVKMNAYSGKFVKN